MSCWQLFIDFIFSCRLVLASCWFASAFKRNVCTYYQFLNFASMPAHHYQPCRDWPVDIRGEGLQGIFLDELQTVVAWLLHQKRHKKENPTQCSLMKWRQVGFWIALWMRVRVFVRVCLCCACDAGRKCALTSSKASVQFRSCGEEDTLIGSFFALSLDFFPN